MRGLVLYITKEIVRIDDGQREKETFLGKTSSLPSPSICHQERKRRISAIELCRLVIKSTEISRQRLVFVPSYSLIVLRLLGNDLGTSAGEGQFNLLIVVVFSPTERERERKTF